MYASQCGHQTVSPVEPFHQKLEQAEAPCRGISIVRYAARPVNIAAGEEHPYFLEQVMVKRPYLREDWIVATLLHPLRREVQPDGRIRFWSLIGEAGKYLRVVTLQDGETVHNAFFDRGFQESP